GCPCSQSSITRLIRDGAGAWAAVAVAAAMAVSAPDWAAAGAAPRARAPAMLRAVKPIITDLISIPSILGSRPRMRLNSVSWRLTANDSLPSEAHPHAHGHNTTDGVRDVAVEAPATDTRARRIAVVEGRIAVEEVVHVQVDLSAVAIS